MNNKKYRHPRKVRTCDRCEECIPLGEGDHICSLTGEIVLEDYIPTEYFAQCNEKRENHEY